MVPQKTPLEVQAMCQGDQPPRLLDVRTRGEHDLAHIEAALLVPMDEIRAHIDELDPGTAWVVICHHGFRSMQVAMWLQAQGFEEVSNLQGGIDRWSIEVDPTVPRY